MKAVIGQEIEGRRIRHPAKDQYSKPKSSVFYFRYKIVSFKSDANGFSEDAKAALNTLYVEKLQDIHVRLMGCGTAGVIHGASNSSFSVHSSASVQNAGTDCVYIITIDRMFMCFGVNGVETFGYRV
ncbi:hypothetical protein FQR65_LT06928 [Abscondita terminalis]|nr:hypothetical protein FQR65_LT06928 [Abscondita terminalis]